MRFYRGETLRAALTRRSRWVGDSIIRGAEGCSTVRGVWSRAKGRSVDEDEELGAAEVGVVEMGQNGL